MPTSVAKYQAFLDQLQDAIALPLPKVAAALLDGDASLAVKDTLPIVRRRKLGAFFTPQKLAERSAAFFGDVPATLFDPACGAGDLLLPIARRLPRAGDAEETLRRWGKVLGGCDIVPQFVDAARLRIALLASVVTEDRVDPHRIPALLPNFFVADGCDVLRKRDGGSLVLNPPFGSVRAPRGHEWMRGQVAKAAIFVERAVQALSPDDRIVAILPDVLRSGSRYARLREWIALNLKDVRVDVYGRFSDSADVDVFVLSGRKRARPPRMRGSVKWSTNGDSAATRVGVDFEVAVGQIVEYRDKSEGAPRAFLASRHMRTWTTQRRLVDKWGAGDRVLRPPFVAVARTSSPSDRFRARASVIAGHRPVAVENHLITARPRSGSLADAERLMAWLATTAVNRFLQDRIRCRHLTVTAVSEIPWRAAMNGGRRRRS